MYPDGFIYTYVHDRCLDVCIYLFLIETNAVINDAN